MVTERIRHDLFAMADEGYRVFQSRLLPTVDPATVIGVRVPCLRKYAKELSDVDAATFMSVLPHTYFDENNLHAFLIERIRDYEKCVQAVDRFLPFVDNWATCDGMRPKVFARHKDAVLQKAGKWVASSHPYTIRYGLEMWMLHGLDETFDPVFLERAASIRSEEYYVRMMVAWFFATALTKRYQDTIPYLENHALDHWTHRKTIQKACESLVMSPEQKMYLKTLKG